MYVEMSIVPVPGWDIFFEELEQFLASLDRYAGIVNEAYSEYALERLEVCIVGVSRLVELFHPSSQLRAILTNGELRIIDEYQSHLKELVTCLRLLAREWSGYFDAMNIHVGQGEYLAASVSTGFRGRPKFEISRSQLEYLESMSFNWTTVARMLGVSRTTIYRRRVEFGMDTSVITTNVNSDELECIIRQVRKETPSLGERMVMGKLRRALGVKASRSRVRSCLRAIDPINTALRWRGQLARRQPYSVAGPNSL